MDTLQVALNLVTPGCYMTSVYLKDAYYTVAVAEDDKKFLRFLWEGQLWQFDSMPNGLALAPRKFTKLMKPVFAKLREDGHLSTSFLDDSLLVADTESECIENVLATVQLLRSLGFVVHHEKSVLEPTQKIQYLGVLIDSIAMTVSLTKVRSDNLIECCKRALKVQLITIRDLAKVIGKLVASFPAVRYGPLFYRKLESVKKAALKKEKGNYDSCTVLSVTAKDELSWWIENVSTAYNVIAVSQPDITVASDASLSGWGCVCEEERSGGLWLPTEAAFHINYLELKAAYFALKCFESKVSQKHVRLLLDNSTAVACINNMGTSHSDSCNDLAFCIWQWCIARGVWLSSAHIPGKENTAADEESRRINVDAEWKLNSDVLEEALVQLVVSPHIDLFASRINTQRSCYVSFKADPEAHAVDAFSLFWQSLTCYAFPPFSIILRVLQKVRRDKASGVIIVPEWKTQVWWPVLLKLLTTDPVRLPSSINLLSLPSHPRTRHRLLPRLQLLACKISGAD
ncbi:hypothetical protein V1264_013207 [Littorina saxatilis]|uniref:Reverse transcriptase domain-containing protein n=1 Tax=Littorina saxatilis TaxID=31220 RepID=A0AAN9BP00_9CAEN